MKKSLTVLVVLLVAGLVGAYSAMAVGVLEQMSEVAQVGCNDRGVWAKRFLHDGERLTEQRFGTSIVCALHQQARCARE